MSAFEVFRSNCITLHFSGGGDVQPPPPRLLYPLHPLRPLQVQGEPGTLENATCPVYATVQWLNGLFGHIRFIVLFL